MRLDLQWPRCLQLQLSLPTPPWPWLRPETTTRQQGFFPLGTYETLMFPASGSVQLKEFLQQNSQSGTLLGDLFTDIDGMCALPAALFIKSGTPLERPTPPIHPPPPLAAILLPSFRHIRLSVNLNWFKNKPEPLLQWLYAVCVTSGIFPARCNNNLSETQITSR